MYVTAIIFIFAGKGAPVGPVPHVEGGATSSPSGGEWGNDTTALWRGEDGRIWHLKTLGVSQCVRDTSEIGRRFHGGVGSPVRWKAFAKSLRSNLAFATRGRRSWRRLRGFALQHHLCRPRKHSWRDCSLNAECCPIGTMSAHLVMLLSSPEAYAFDVRLLGALAPGHQWEKLGAGLGYAIWNPGGIRIIDILYSGWPYFSLLRELQFWLWRIVKRPPKGVGADALSFRSTLALLMKSVASASKAAMRQADKTYKHVRSAAVCMIMSSSRKPERACPAMLADISLMHAEQILTLVERGGWNFRKRQSFHKAVHAAEDNLAKLMWRVQASSVYFKAPSARVVMAFLICADAILPRLERMQQRIDRTLTLEVPHVSTGEKGNSDITQICPAATFREQGSLSIEAEYLHDFHTALNGAQMQGKADSVRSVDDAKLLPTVAVRARAAKQAWVVFIWGGGGIKAQRSALLQSELVRTLAYSVRRAEKPLRRAFIVMTAGKLPLEAEEDLKRDGLRVQVINSNSTMPMWEPTWVTRPKYAGNWFNERGLQPSYPQLAAWELLEFDRIVVLDADTLVLGRCDELFDLKGVSFAASPETHADQGAYSQIDSTPMRTYLFNAGVISLRPSPQVLQDLLTDVRSPAFKYAVEKIGVFGMPTFQGLIDTYLLSRQRRRGLVRFGPLGTFEGCTQTGHNLSPLQGKTRHKDQILSWNALGADDHCLLPQDYNFFVDFAHVFQIAKIFRENAIHGEDSAAAAAAVWDAPRALLLNATARFMRAKGLLQHQPKIIHFPGSLRKPWQRWATISRSPWDEAWWDAHDSMCAHSDAPCRISCNSLS